MPDTNKRTYQSMVMALPELKMVLVHAGNDRQNAVEDIRLDDDDGAEELDKKRLVRKIIRHLEMLDQ